MRIGEIAERADVSTKALRYQRVGLLDEPDQSDRQDDPAGEHARPGRRSGDSEDL